ncbi:cob(I)yrinic acid a,c-diamide adenosyltransferase [Acinetobacter larvae]|uniref:Corrinoid adenosyltransferase n=1 Tax=Acinetobacter larvae TaxID=1789224 RepID=A0A1B2M3S0_9GAMM|nr:cob(I)yrinic acid a,c-diamide adenosyltransferase [Acinetobacter larvae]AOA59850.1 ATP:cob(I)alamin adenosyltransferase [Acinetobacter larvae]
MGHRLSKIYTRTGDQGETGLGDGSRLSKDDLRIHALGDIDELNALIGLLAAHIQQDNSDQQGYWAERLRYMQHALFDLGGEVCIPNHHVLNAESITFLEADIDQMNQQLPMLKDFILPAGSLSCSYAHQARAVCRRAERQLCAVQQRDQNIQQNALQFLNRLSDWLFVAARCLQRQQAGHEVLWQKNITAPVLASNTQESAS